LSDTDSERRRRKKKDKHRSRDEKRERKREKKEKKVSSPKNYSHKRTRSLQKKRHGTASGAQWGKYGIISETESVQLQQPGTCALILLTSFYNKTQEFRTWLLEERKINPEAISKDQERKEFAVFVEDYNTGA
jgi:hypothetical protein